MKSELAKARDKWLNSDEGKHCCEGLEEAKELLFGSNCIPNHPKDGMFIEDCPICLIKKALALLRQPAEQPSELVKKIRSFSQPVPWPKLLILKAADELDRLATERSELSAQKVQVENECCVLRGELERLKKEIVELKTQTIGGSENDSIIEEAQQKGDE